MPGALYSVGYEGLEQSDFVRLLVDCGVRLVVDVRLNAVSRKRGFSKTALAAAMRTVGVEYRHEPSLGNPVANRTAFSREEHDEAAGRVRLRIASEGADAIDRLASEAAVLPIALMCVEEDERRCHRHVVLELVRERVSPIEVIRLRRAVR